MVAKIGDHFAAAKFKRNKGFKTKHQLQHALLNLSNHQLNVVDELVNASHGGRAPNPMYFPRHDHGDISKLALDLKGHTHSQIAIARRARDLTGAGFSSLLNASVDMAKVGAAKLAPLVGKAAKIAGKVGKAALKKSRIAAKWAMENPGLALKIGAAVIPAVTTIATLARGGDDESSDELPPQHREAIDQLVGTTGSESDEKVETTAYDRYKKQRGGGLATKGRWVI